MNPRRQTLPLKQAVREHQAAQQLNPEQLDRLLAIQTEWSVSAQGRSLSARRPQLAFSAVAGITLAFLLGWLVQWQTLPITDPDSNPMIPLIADEVVLNHLKLKPMEIESGDLEELRAYFKQLDFRPAKTALLASAESKLIGGRYCSIQDRIAVQLRIDNADSGARMLYQTSYNPKRIGYIPDLDSGESPIVTMARGVPVKIWVEKGLLFAITGSDAPAL